VIEKAARQAAVLFEGVTLTGEYPAEAILETAKKRRCEVIVMASHGRRGLAGVLLGSETQKVLTHAKMPVHVCR
jgi:nucleotide-binding universal stress UspA family protein